MKIFKALFYVFLAMGLLSLCLSGYEFFRSMRQSSPDTVSCSQLTANFKTYEDRWITADDCYLDYANSAGGYSTVSGQYQDFHIPVLSDRQEGKSPVLLRTRYQETAAPSVEALSLKTEKEKSEWQKKYSLKNSKPVKITGILTIQKTSKDPNLTEALSLTSDFGVIEDGADYKDTGLVYFFMTLISVVLAGLFFFLHGKFSRN